MVIPKGRDREHGAAKIHGWRMAADSTYRDRARDRDRDKYTSMSSSMVVEAVNRTVGDISCGRGHILNLEW